MSGYVSWILDGKVDQGIVLKGTSGHLCDLTMNPYDTVYHT